MKKLIIILISFVFVSCGTSNLTQREIQIYYELDKLRTEYIYKTDSLYIELNKNK